MSAVTQDTSDKQRFASSSVICWAWEGSAGSVGLAGAREKAGGEVCVCEWGGVMVNCDIAARASHHACNITGSDEPPVTPLCRLSWWGCAHLS